jgi:hypothetical protein
MLPPFRAALLLALLLSSQLSSATEPLHDHLVFGNRSGVIFPPKCCWVDLPKTERLQAMRKAERCSAIGGPVGQFKYEAGQLWLTGLYRCGGPVPLKDVYPDFDNPALAVWLSGTFHARLDWLCRDKQGRFVYGTELTLTVERGTVTAVSEANYDKSSC